MKSRFSSIMGKCMPFLFPAITIGVFSCSGVQEHNDAAMAVKKSLVFPQGDRIMNDNFSGTAYLALLVNADSLNPTAVGNVTFEAGARTRWHLHPAGQILLVIDGEGYYQEKGGSKRILHKGNVVKCPPDTPHWHGASADSSFIQVAITNNQKGPTVWLEKVTEEEYTSGQAP